MIRNVGGQKDYIENKYQKIMSFEYEVQLLCICNFIDFSFVSVVIQIGGGNDDGSIIK